MVWLVVGFEVWQKRLMIRQRQEKKIMPLSAVVYVLDTVSCGVVLCLMALYWILDLVQPTVNQ